MTLFFWSRKWSKDSCMYVGKMRRKKVVLRADDMKIVKRLMELGFFDQEMHG